MKLRAVEFFSGIGGWRSALQRNDLPFEIIEAYDINNLSNLVYQHNFSHKPNQRSIESISLPQLEKMNAHIWLMSPPCQPFTRNNTTESRDVFDSRSTAFLHIIRSLESIINRPRHIFLENVVGFEDSECCKHYLSVIKSRGYHVQQFILNPIDMGIPNERPRYYSVAWLPTDKICPVIDSDLIYRSIPGVIYPQVPPPLLEYLDDLSAEELTQYLIPAETLSKSASWCLDIVQPSSCRSSCFTKSYTRFIRGTGSVLLIPNPEHEGKDSEVKQPQQQATTETTETQRTTIQTQLETSTTTENETKKPRLNNTVDESTSSFSPSSSSPSSSPSSSSLDPSSLESFPSSSSSSSSSSLIDILPPPNLLLTSPSERVYDPHWFEHLNQQSPFASSSSSSAILPSLSPPSSPVIITSTSSTLTSSPSSTSSPIPLVVEMDNNNNNNNNPGRFQLRYFTPEELLKIFGFPISTFHFPYEKLTKRNKVYEMIGNSLNVFVASELIRYIGRSEMSSQLSDFIHAK